MGSAWYGFYILESRMSPPHALTRFALCKAGRIGGGPGYRNPNPIDVTVQAKPFGLAVR